MYETFLNSSANLSKIKIFYTYVRNEFRNLDELKMELKKYVLWYNNKRIHGTLNYMAAVEYYLKSMNE